MSSSTEQAQVHVLMVLKMRYSKQCLPQAANPKMQRGECRRRKPLRSVVYLGCGNWGHLPWVSLEGGCQAHTYPYSTHGAVLHHNQCSVVTPVSRDLPKEVNAFRKKSGTYFQSGRSFQAIVVWCCSRTLFFIFFQGDQASTDFCIKLLGETRLASSPSPLGACWITSLGGMKWANVPLHDLFG